jgi:hypothetical protein
MPFRDLFPWTNTLWRLISSKPVRIVLISLVSLLVLSMIAFRLESFFFQRRVNLLLSRLARLQLDRSSAREINESLPELKSAKDENSPERTSANADENEQGLFLFQSGDLEDGPLIRWLRRGRGSTNLRLKLLCRLGHRFHDFSARVRTRRGTIDQISFWLRVESSQSCVPGFLISIGASGYGRLRWEGIQEPTDISYAEISPYVERVASDIPENSVGIMFTPDAPPRFAQAAFDVHMTCLWTFSGCKDTQQMLPGIWPPNFPLRRWIPGRHRHPD